MLDLDVIHNVTYFTSHMRLGDGRVEYFIVADGMIFASSFEYLLYSKNFFSSMRVS